MADIAVTQIEAALERGACARETEPRTTFARYDSALGKIVVDLTNGCTFAFPPQLVQELETASDAHLAQVVLKRLRREATGSKAVGRGRPCLEGGRS